MRAVRRLAPLFLALGLLALAGCSGLFDRSYYSREVYQAPAAQEEAGEAPAYDSISNFASLRRAVLQLVTDHVESAQLQFAGYEGSISQDLSTACWEVKSSTALGAFAVDYISYDLSRIVSYYQAEVNITYRRSTAQVDALERAVTVSALTDRLDRALRAGETYLVLEIADASATEDSLREYISKAYYADPLACPVLPEAEVGLYPEAGMDRIAELSLNYGLEQSELTRRREDLTGALEEVTDGLVPADEAPEGLAGEELAQVQAERLQTLCARLSARCLAEEDAGTTAWDALTAGAADSEGMALAVEAGCQALGLDCRVVAGRMGGEDHFWDMVTLNGTCYHLDLSAGGDGVPAVFLSGDAALLGDYWWDTSDYPACPGSFGAEDEPEPTPAPTPEPARSPIPIVL